ncbi:eIF-2-alpha kinase activator GCN1-like [Mya arenaria]|uniref:eIF-2-alpha kinase activator GCN1-like n=1 Tax=Mya arenaria TaxID=6604 RepID=UPI0022E4649D|nr:eIF-2-alpha kinase activator GCN1-like [Mya arenaria]
MADHVSTSTAELLKKFSKVVLSPSTKERSEVLDSVAKCVTETDLPEQALKGIFKFLQPTITVYRDAKSLRSAQNLVVAAIKKEPAISLKLVTSILASCADAQKKLVHASKSSAGDSLVALSWSCAALHLTFQKDTAEPALLKLIECQVGLVYGALAGDNTSISNGTYRKMRNLWKMNKDVMAKYSELLQRTEASFHAVCIMALYARFVFKEKHEKQLDAIKESFIELYMKQVLGSRTRPPMVVLKCGRDILRHCSHDTFKSMILPFTQKALLRNPEIILEAFGYMLSSLQLDLSQYAETIIKPLGAQLTSKEPSTRDEACKCIQNLATQCSDHEIVTKVTKHLFGVFNGSEGKLTLQEQKMSVVQAVGNMSCNSVSGPTTLQDLSATVTELFIPLLSTEVHEATLIHALSIMSLWCAKFYTKVPDKLMQWFQKGYTLKSSTSPVRNAYIQCMNASFHGDTMLQGLEMVPILIQSMEKAGSQSTQVALVTEAVSAANILVKLCLVDINEESKFAPFWSLVLDSDKQVLVNEKYLSSVSETALEGVVTLSEKLILEFPTKIIDKVAKPFYRALAYCLTRKAYTIRKFTRKSISRLLSTLGGTSISLELIEVFNELLATQKVVDVEALNFEEGDRDTILEQMKYISPRILSSALVAMAAVKKPEVKDAVSIAKATLIPAHHPCVLLDSGDTWTDSIMFALSQDARNFIQNNKQFCLDLLEGKLTESKINAIKTLARIAPDEVLPSYVAFVERLLGNDDLVMITKDEYGAYRCHEGELYDEQLASSLNLKLAEDHNIRRENKLYSYKEQMEELELRMELARKKGKPVVEKPKLSKKQEEVLQAQLKKESAIRARLTLLNHDLCKGCDVVRALVSGNAASTGLYMRELCRVLVPLLQSPLAAGNAADVMAVLGASAFEDENLGNLLSNCTIRLLKPECGFHNQWCDEQLQKQATRVVNILFAESVPEHEDEYYESNKDERKEMYPAPCFAFMFYLLSSVLTANGVAVGRDEAVMGKALKLISTHAKMRNDSKDQTKKPDLFPIKELLHLLIRVIGVSSMKIQQRANVALVEVATCVSGKPGCAHVKEDEIRVILESLKSTCTTSRESALQALKCLVSVLPNIDDNFELGLSIAQRVWVACYDVDENVRALAQSLREDLGLDEPYDEMCSPLVDDITHPEEIIRRAAAECLAKALTCHKENIDATIQLLLMNYEKKLEMPPPILDEFGRVVSEQMQDEWQPRTGVAMALGHLAPILPPDQLLSLFNFYVPKGLGDRSSEVRSQMRQAALAAINVHGKDNVSELLPVFEEFLTNSPGTASYDAVRQSIVILMGSLAKHLDKDNPKVKPIVGQLISALSTPSQDVQESVANCLPPLVPAVKSDAPELVHKLMDLLLQSDNYGERKGAAYGLAGLVRGLGITALKQLDIMTTLEEAVKDKKNPRRREGALFAYEMMCSMLGKLFEPYVVHILPHLLLCFGDNSQYVREAADETSKAVMKMLTAHGVKLVLPSLLKGLEEDSWRTKAGAVELLGSMAYCAPKQLSACLPSIVPKISEVLTDSHVRVQKAGSQALRQIGNVIRNPEIQAIVPVLMDALQDPARKTSMCLQTLLETKFVHFIDAPSLALIMPVVERAFQDRATETRKMSAQIIGNMYSLTDQKDLDPYIEKVIPGLKQSLLDPVPEVRSVSARALGAMVKGMGGARFDELMNWLMETLKSEGSSVDRSGAAQGLAEVVGGMGLADLHKLMPIIISTGKRMDIPPHVRDGYIMMYIYLPSVFKEDFKQYIGPIIPSILQALADECEYVRETALRAGQRIINMYANTAISLLLPELEMGLFDDNWRIRYSSIQLLGDLLYSISGVSGKMSTESAGEDDNFGTESSQTLILKVLGVERRNRVLSGLYMGRCDSALLVRQAALHVWKVVVPNTPRTLREILSTLFSQLLGCLASTSHDKRQVAARTLGDLVRKLGERVLPEIIPILESGLQSEQSEQRQGVCIGLREIMNSTQREHIMFYADSLIPTVKQALCDPLPEVREAAASTFDRLHTNIGSRALDDILPDLLSKLGDGTELSEQALDGLTQVMIVKSRVVLPYLVPQLTHKPVNTRALSYLASVSGEALTKHLPKILPALMSALSEKAGTPEEAQELEYCRNVVLSVEDEVGVRTIMEELLGAAKSTEPDRCRSSVTILHSFCENTRVSYEEFLPQLFRGLIELFVRKDQEVLLAAWECLNAITKKLNPQDMLEHIHNVRQAIKFASSDMQGEELPGFSIPKKGITPVLPIFREGILTGSQDIKELSAIALGELIKKTSAEALKPSVVQVTGPLIRILGDRFAPSVKTAVLETLTLLLSKVGVMLKPFLPQLQTTFMKALNDPNRSVRLKAASALGKLIVIHTRVDPLFTELHSGIKNAEETSVRDTMLQALRFCLAGAGAKMSPANRKLIVSSLVELLGSPEDSTRMVASGCVGVLCGCLPEEELTALLIQELFDTGSSVDWTLRHGRGTALGVALQTVADKLWSAQYTSSVRKAVTSLTEADRIPLCMSGYQCLGYIIDHLVATGTVDLELVQAFTKGLRHDSNDVKQLIGQIVCYITSKLSTPLDATVCKVLVSPLVMGTKEKNTVVKTNSELALISLLQLRKNDSYFKSVLRTLDSGMQDVLAEVYSKSLKKMATQHEPPADRIDDTVLI